jgi:prepilin-type N-terminal cleavage/methylation domain-containing protein
MVNQKKEYIFKGGDFMRTAKLSTRGFTLVELLIVIALLGALAIGLIGALDPFEQLKKGQDTGTRNTVSEVQSAIIRFYALKGIMPWCTADPCPAADVASMQSGSSGLLLNDNAMSAVLDRIVQTGELKSNFTTLQSKEMGKVHVTGTDSQAIVCYQPVSKSFRADANTKFDATGGTPAGTCDTTDANACFWCVQ